MFSSPRRPGRARANFAAALAAAAVAAFLGGALAQSLEGGMRKAGVVAE